MLWVEIRVRKNKLRVNRIVQRQFHHEYYENTFSTDIPEVQLQKLKEIEAFVADKFGKDLDLKKTTDFVRLLILYKQSKIPF